MILLLDKNSVSFSIANSNMDFDCSYTDNFVRYSITCELVFFLCFPLRPCYLESNLRPTMLYPVAVCGTPPHVDLVFP